MSVPRGTACSSRYIVRYGTRLAGGIVSFQSRIQEGVLMWRASSEGSYFTLNY